MLNHIKVYQTRSEKKILLSLFCVEQPNLIGKIKLGFFILTILCHMKLTALQEGIKSVGIGRKGSKALEGSLVDHIIDELRACAVPGAVEGAFIAALMNKGMTSDESRILDYVGDPIEFLMPAESNDIKTLCHFLLKGNELNKYQADVIGRYILSDKSNAAVCGLVASTLRVRYETYEEYTSLLKCIHATFSDKFKTKVPAGRPIVQIAEPFNGFNKTNVVTPLIAEYIQCLGYRVVTLAGRNSGPKQGNNIQDIARGLGAVFLDSTDDCIDNNVPYGYYLDQSDVSQAMDRWVDIRRQIIKRPFMATLERLINPLQADILIASAFHPPYGEKMLDIAEYAGFKKIIIIRNGLEGGTSFALKRSTKVLISINKQREEIEFNAEKELGVTVPVEEKIVPPSLMKNIELIKRYHDNGQTGYDLFDWRLESAKKCFTYIFNEMFSKEKSCGK